MKLEKLISDHSTLAELRQNQIEGGFTHRLTVKYTDINTSGAVGDYISGDGGTTNGKSITVPITTPRDNSSVVIPAGSILEKVALNVTTAFAGTDISALVADMGISGNTDSILDGVNLRGTNVYVSGYSGDGAAHNISSSTSALNVPIKITPTGAATTALSAGEFQLYLKVSTLPTQSFEEVYSI